MSSGTNLLGHFLDHYRRLGVDEFLLTLHAEASDPRAQDMLDIMASHGISPRLRTAEFNTRLKLERYRALIGEHCRPEDWILYADMDEFHAYPVAIHELLASCDAAGYRFVRGRMRDRLAAGGQLVPMRPVPSLWEQFPFRASVTSRIRQGWDRKVCAAKPDVVFDEGGMHCLAYGHDRSTNYRLTHLDARGFPNLVDIDHFAWDDTLLKRIETKLAGLGGDSDSTDDPVVMAEYERVRVHLLAHGNIAADDFEVAPLPTHHYER
ncbi:glycosyltransferase family 2 protein [Thermomonas carbonis]|uniref:Glycosyltransferase family 2 protein n=1 Tax=Thermomonas carbonis TaxID=1463158 RepID=A0A7G9SMR0_9GAMM|nr:glycosyltransferase family 2 protein [Thermomonas carbonis]QNN69135.1 glycosyltransferase family 2 protein [Thermomonas carbonis]GHC06523.1 hypothetical protein GCM10010080_20830 [Thermomonas carbonis]